MKTVIGLGNPGEEYRGTRHNVGFEVLDLLAAELGVSFEKGPGPVLVAEGEAAGGPFRLLKPQGWMNLSGETLGRFLQAEKADPDDFLVVLDDLALPLGKVRLRLRGGHGGHNGLRSLLEFFGSQDLKRLRIGIGGAGPDEWKEHVLSPFGADERALLQPALERVVEGLRGYLDGMPLERLQEWINTASPPGEPRGTVAAEDVARATPRKPAAGRLDATGGSVVDTKPHLYEGMFLLNQSKISPESGDAVGFVQGLLKKHEFKEVRTEVWDERRLAYPIKHQKRGTYVLSYFEGDGSRIDPLRRELNITEEILRYLFIRHRKEFPPFPKPRRELKETRPARSGESEKAAEAAAGKSSPAASTAPAAASETPAPGAAPEMPVPAESAPAEESSAPQAAPDTTVEETPKTES